MTPTQLHLNRLSTNATASTSGPAQNLVAYTNSSGDYQTNANFGFDGTTFTAPVASVGMENFTGAATGTYAVSSASQGRIFYDSTLQHFYLSENGGAYAQIQTGGATPSFSTLTSGTNTSATMTVGSGATFQNTGTGKILVHPAINAQTASGYTLVLTDDSSVVTLNTSTAQNLNIPTNASVAFPIGTTITVVQIGTGQWTIQATTPGTTTIISTGATSTAPILRVQGSGASLIKTATDTWLVVGDIV